MPVEAAVAVIYKGSGPDIELLFIRRRERPGDPWSGHIAFPGGRRREGDSSLMDTVIREVMEEVGIDLRREAEFVCTARPTGTLVNPDIIIYPYVFRYLGEGGVRSSDEVGEAFWIPIRELRQGICMRFLTPLEDIASVRCFRWLRRRDIVIWGVTYRIFRSVMREVFGVDPDSL